MKLTFLGAAQTVTGSCYLMEANNKKVLIDCGMFQGHDKEEDLNFEPFPFDVGSIDYLFLTHAHIDHSGKIPKLCKEGFKGEIICTKATADLCSIMLPDSGYIQESEIEWKNRKRKRAGRPLLEPLYTYQDALNSLKYFKPVSYHEVINLDGNITIKFSDAGHILGSSILEIWVREENSEIKVVFTGDLGNYDIPLLRDPEFIESADYLIIESTYGNRMHKENENKLRKLMNIIEETIQNGGNVVIPSFAVGRTQEIIYEIHKYRQLYQKDMEFLKTVPVYVDSPLAISATEIFRKNLDCYDEEARTYIENGDNPLDFPNLIFTRTPDESKMLNEKKEPCIIISASGMCEAGRIRHHLKHNLWREDSTVLFVGYQAPGTLGRRILDGIKKVKILGEEISIKARIESIEGYSGHADQKGLVNWVSHLKKMPKKTFIVHGEIEAQKVFAKLLKDKFGIKTVIPQRGDSYELTPFEAKSKESIKHLRDNFIRLQLLAQLDMLAEEVYFLTNNVDQEALNIKEDEEIKILQTKIEEIGASIKRINSIIKGSF
ncbi:MBL fold metallo-hydrolase RNA specificity domain-containing protein [Defluviitalea phaphyphila]|uniref:MBL fold metallo-hydrolase RNA specificity domain-containing protein n=1 Tax=Defluviitalea phaphyphila TaxID=1473580 RepID=UPI0007307515|nr:MBL fold metallo-hydrolase [Defluviitalea phaphyphila]